MRLRNAGAVAVVALSLSIAACNRAATPDVDTASRDGDASTTTSTAPAVPDTTIAGTIAPPSTAAVAGTPDKARFCDAASVLIEVPETQTPQEYEAAVATATATMVATVPDRSLVPLMTAMQKAYALYATVATAEAAADPAGAERAVAEAEAAFPEAERRRFADYVKAECGIDVGT